MIADIQDAALLSSFGFQQETTASSSEDTDDENLVVFPSTTYCQLPLI